MRHCCRSTSRGFDMDISYIPSGNPMDPIATDFALADRSCNLARCCLCRPEMIITIKGTKEIVGRLYRFLKTANGRKRSRVLFMKPQIWNYLKRLYDGMLIAGCLYGRFRFYGSRTREI